MSVNSDGQSTANQTIEEPGVFIRFGRWLMPAGVGILLAFVIGAAFHRILTASNARHQDSFDDALVVTQQLDSLFTIIEVQLREDGSQLASYRELMDTFLAFDRQYLEQASNNPAMQLAKAYAAKRIGHCCLALGALEDSREYYRQARDLFASCLQADPNIIGLYSQWLNAQGQIAVVEFQRGDMPAAEMEYRAAFRILQQSKPSPDSEYHDLLLPELKSLAMLGIQLKLYPEAAQVAERFAYSASVLTEMYPEDTDFAEDAVDAQECLEILSSLLFRQGSQ